MHLSTFIVITTTSSAKSEVPQRFDGSEEDRSEKLEKNEDFDAGPHFAWCVVGMRGIESIVGADLKCRCHVKSGPTCIFTIMLCALHMARAESVVNVDVEVDLP